jgi:transposase
VLRQLTRRRGTLIAERTREKNRLSALLEDAGIKLAVVATDIFVGVRPAHARSPGRG